MPWSGRSSPTGTLLAARAQRGEHLQVQLSPDTKAWVALAAVAPAPAGTAVPRVHATTLSLSGQPEGDVLQVPLAAAVLALAKSLKHLGATAQADVMFVLYTNEEPPFFKTPQMGSQVHAQALRARGAPVVAMLSLETMGYFSNAEGSQKYPWPLNQFYPTQGDFIAFVATTPDLGLARRVVRSFRSHAAFPSEGIAAPRFIPGVDYSDHAAYIDAGYPALMVTDTAPYRYPHYHTREDTSDKVDYDRLARVVQGLEGVVRDLAHRP